jgi:rhomboid family GlyGly-CTERM serine protease
MKPPAVSSLTAKLAGALSLLPAPTTLALCAAALLTYTCGLEERLQYDRSAIAAGEWWRLLTGQLTHWSGDHLFWDLSVFGLLGGWCEKTQGRRFFLCLAGSTLAILLLLWFGKPEIALYRGLSGIDSALFLLAAATALREDLERRRWPVFLTTSAVLAGFCAKTVFEAVTGRTVFVDSARGGFQPVVLVHAVGAAAALVVALWGSGSPLRPRPRWRSGAWS